jgi:Lar family restriction alleviation protein
MIEVQIRPCPFCGQEEELVVTGEEDGVHDWAVYCDDCGASGPFVPETYTKALPEEYKRAFAIDRWNRRRRCD